MQIFESPPSKPDFVAMVLMLVVFTFAGAQIVGIVYETYQRYNKRECAKQAQTVEDLKACIAKY